MARRGWQIPPIEPNEPLPLANGLQLLRLMYPRQRAIWLGRRNAVETLEREGFGSGDYGVSEEDIEIMRDEREARDAAFQVMGLLAQRIKETEAEIAAATTE